VGELERQLRWLRLYALLTYPFACVPFLFLFFTREGLDQAGYGKVIAVYYAVMFTADVPTSLLADRLGRRAMLVLGPLLLGAGFLLLFVWRGFAGFCAGEGLMGLGHSVLSGPPSAILYDLLRRHGAAHRYLHEEARVQSLRLCGTGGSFLLGGLVAWLWRDGLGYAYAATIPPTCALALLGALVATRVRAEPPPAGVSFAGLARRAAQDLHQREVWWLLAYWVVLFALLRFPFHDYQPYLGAAAAQEPLLANPLVVGAVFGLMNLLAAPLSRRVPALVQRCGRLPLFTAMPLVLCASLALMALERAFGPALPCARLCAWGGVLLLFVQQVPFGMHWALVQEFVNHRIAPDARATVWSVLSLGGRLAYAPLNVWLFALQDAHGMPPVLLGVAAGGALLAVLVMAARPAGLLRRGNGG
jgi:hypothetical protein